MAIGGRDANVVYNYASAWDASAVAESLALQREQVAWQRRAALAAEAQQHMLAQQQRLAQHQQRLLQLQVEQQRRSRVELMDSGNIEGEDAEFDDYEGDAEYREACEIFGRFCAPRLRAASEEPTAYLGLSQDDAVKVTQLYVEHGWTQVRLARLLECSQSKVSKLLGELGVRR
jgi:DNA-binding transcriptional regulator LsrR (DeoR family)